MLSQLRLDEVEIAVLVGFLPPRVVSAGFMWVGLYVDVLFQLYSIVSTTSKYSFPM